ncbi:MAG: thrombospondin type 3 repeat-containing protein [Myxococcota bacterium]
MTPRRLARTLRWVSRALCAVALLAAQTASSADIGTAPQIGSFATRGPYVPGFLSGTVQNAVHDATGVVYTTDTVRVTKFDRDGNLLLVFNCSDCYGIAVNQVTGEVYTTLYDNNVVQEYHPDGTFVRQWGSSGSGNGQFNHPHGIAVDPVTGSVYIFDTVNGRIQVFDQNGNFQRKFGQTGAGAGDFSGLATVSGLAFDSVNRWLYVTDPIRYHVQKFTETGTYLFSFGEPSSSQAGHLRWDRGVAIDPSGNVYTADTDNERIQYFTSDGVYVAQFQGPHDLANGPFHPRAISINGLTGEKYVNASYANREDKFDANNQYVKSWGGKNQDGSYVEGPRGINVAPNGDVYVLDSFDFMVKRFSQGGAFQKQWGGSNRINVAQPGLIGYATQGALGVQPNGDVWTGMVGAFYYDDPPTPWLVRFDRNGAVTGALFRKPATTNYEESVTDIAVDPASGDLFVADNSFRRLKRITQAGATVVDLPVAEAGGLALANGKVFMVDSAFERIHRYTLQLVEEAAIGATGSGDGQLNLDTTSGIAVRPSDGEIFVADSRNNRIQEFTSAGTFVAKRGGLGTGSGPGQFILPEDVAISPTEDVLYVADTFNHRFQMFCLTTLAACNAIIDRDGDGKPDYQDNCIDVANPDQADSDGDGIGDACDACPLDGKNDVDGDGVCGNVDNCPLVPNPDQADSDHNGVGDACETCPSDPLGDVDLDHICGSVDNCPYTANPGQEDVGGLGGSTPDGVGDACQCGDVASNGVIDAADLAAYRANLAQASPSTYTAPAKCKVSGDGLPCSILDVAILTRALAAGGPLQPGISQTCAAAVP